MTEEIPQGEAGGHAVPSYEETVRRLLRTPEAKAEAARQGLDTDEIAEMLIRDYHRPLLLDLDPRTEQPEAADAERLLRAEAERRGTTVDALIDDLARTSTSRRPIPDLDRQPSATVWNHRRGGVGKSSAVRALLDRLRPEPGAGGAVASGTMRSGKTPGEAERIRTELDARGARYTERTVTRRGVEMVEFDVEHPQADEEL
ncbi:hypothetical protein [Streptomyces sp. NPDC091416]|uniref:hypothetical protein n=1 Tax=Streptomyces sp. NPDC091416 TaxID=3366003 RepID=UPI00381C3CA8